LHVQVLRRLLARHFTCIQKTLKLYRRLQRWEYWPETCAFRALSQYLCIDVRGDLYSRLDYQLKLIQMFRSQSKGIHSWLLRRDAFERIQSDRGYMV
jgi:hypothetical protein